MVSPGELSFKNRALGKAGVEQEAMEKAAAEEAAEQARLAAAEAASQPEPEKVTPHSVLGAVLYTSNCFGVVCVPHLLM